MSKKIELKDDNLNSSDEDEKASLLANCESSSTSLSRSPSPEPESESESSEPTTTTDPRFVQPPASRFKRTSLLIFLALLFWLAYSMRANLLDSKRKVKIIHASRYSKDHKFRPAASPIVTETLKDGRVRLRGALPEPTAPPVSPPVKKKRKPSAGKVSGKRKSGGTKPKPRAVNQQRI